MKDYEEAIQTVTQSQENQSTLGRTLNTLDTDGLAIGADVIGAI